MSETAHNFEFTSIDGDVLPLKQFEGKAVLIVNTASQCGFTPQYEGLQALYEARKDEGLVVLGVPSNQFGGQEPGSEEEIKSYCEINYGINFPMTEKEEVKGRDAHPFYQWAEQNYGAAAVPRWNFHKLLVSKDGKIVGAYQSSVKPQSDELKADIDKALTTS